MVDDFLEELAFDSYVEQLRQGSTDVYVASRVFRRHWKLTGPDERWLRQATIVLIEKDPWFLATEIHTLSALTMEDIERLSPLVGQGLATGVASMLRAILWYESRKGSYHPDDAGRVQLQTCLNHLKKVPLKQRSQKWHQMHVGCYRVLDFEQYKRAFPALLNITLPEWRAHERISLRCGQAKRLASI
jgi:hypothetical protein